MRSRNGSPFSELRHRLASVAARRYQVRQSRLERVVGVQGGAEGRVLLQRAVHVHTLSRAVEVQEAKDSPNAIGHHAPQGQ